MSKCPYYKIFSSPGAAFDAGDDCMGSDCNYWKQERGVGECEITDEDHARRLFAGEE